MVGGGGACFVADACFHPDVVRKHGIPFCADLDRALETLAGLPALDGAWELVSARIGAERALPLFDGSELGLRARPTPSRAATRGA